MNPTQRSSDGAAAPKPPQYLDVKLAMQKMASVQRAALAGGTSRSCQRDGGLRWSADRCGRLVLGAALRGRDAGGSAPAVGRPRLLLREPGVCRMDVLALVALDKEKLGNASLVIEACDE